MLNKLLVGRYRVIEVLGKGGLGQTYIAIDQHQPSRPKCAVKLLKPASKDSSFLPIARRLFVTEAEILEKLGRHDQIPQLLAYFEEKKEFFIIQDYIEGHTLGAELPLGHRWTENKVILMLQDVLKTLEFVHSYGVIHRDIKPNNLIRRDKDGKIVLIDFGAVKQVGDSRITTKVPLTPKTISIGTQGYMPTEQARGKPRLNSDIYALGMIGIQALTGIDPFNLEENIDGEVIWRNYAQVSDKLAAILNQMVRYHFRDRYQSTTEVLQELESLKSHSPVTPMTAKNSLGGAATLSESEFRETRVSLPKEPSEVRVVPPERSEQIEVAQDINPAISREDHLVELKETRVSLSKEPSEVRVVPHARSEQIEVAQDINPAISREDHLVELKETRVSLDSEHSDQKVSSKPELEQVTKPQQGNAWSSWENKDTPLDLKPQKTPPETKLANSVGTLSESEFRETRVSLSNEPSEVRVVPPERSEQIEVAQDINPAISREDHLVELKETRVSLDSEHSDQKVSSKPELEQVTKPQQGNAWSSWENKDTPLDLKPQKIPPEVKQANSVVTDSEKQKVTSGLVEIDSWGRWNSETVAKSGKNKTNKQKSLKSNDLELETASPIDAQKSQTIQNIQQKKQEVDIKPQIKETKISQGNERLNPQAASKISLKETKASLSNENEKLVSETKQKEIKTSLTNDKSVSKEVAKIATKETKVSLSSEAQNTSNISNIEIIKTQLILGIKQLTSLIDKRKIVEIINLIFTKASLIPLQFSRVKSPAFLVRDKKYPLLIGIGTILALFSSFAGYKYIKHRQSYHQLKLDLATIEQLEADKKYQECIEEAILFSNKFSDLSSQKNSILSDCYQGQLTTATKLAKGSRYKDAINLAIQIPQEQDIYTESQKLVSQWSQNIYQIASNKYQEGDLENAIAILQAIPDNSPLSKKIQTTSKQWQADWEQNQTHIEAAQKGLDEKRWQDAINEAKKVKNNPYWLDQSKELITQAETAIAAEAAARKTYRSPSRPRYRSNPKTYYPPATPINPVITPSPLPNPEPTESSDSTEPNEPDRTPIVCLNKNSRNPKCRNSRK